MKTTNQRVIERYHSYRRRPSLEDPRIKELQFRSFRRTLGRWLPKDPSARILDVACGEGSLLVFLRELGFVNLSGFDLSPENVAICRKVGLSFVQEFDVLKLHDFESLESYDIIFALDIVEHLPQPLAADFLEQVLGRLAPGGYAVFQTPNMGCVFGLSPRYCDLTHEFGVTESSAMDLFLAAGFRAEDIEIRAAWNAATPLGYLREAYLRLLHRVIYLAEDSARPAIPTKNLLIRASKSRETHG